MSYLKNGCNSGKVRYARLPDRLVLERAAERMADRPTAAAKNVEPWVALLERIDLSAPSTIRPRELKRLLRDIWVEQGCEGLESGLMDDGVLRDRASIDRAIVESYLLRFPKQHSAFQGLRAASALVAERRDWPWRARGQEFHLWDEEEGPRRLALELLCADNPAVLLRRAGLDGELATGSFVRQAVCAACITVASQAGAQAVAHGQRLIALASMMQGADGVDEVLALALLAPWLNLPPPEKYQQQVTAFLTNRIGDPRRDSDGKWQALAAKLRAADIDTPADEIFSLLRRWLVQATVREFFAIVTKTTDRRDQWKERTAFWLGYLDTGNISDAWFAFGSQAENEAERFISDQSMAFGRIEGQGATPNQSALLMTIGDMRIAEWSDNGSCRFWPDSDDHGKAPQMYQTTYYALVLRSMDAESGYEPIAHMGTTWQNRIAKRIFDRTGIEHPKYGQGW